MYIYIYIYSHIVEGTRCLGCLGFKDGLLAADEQK